jgi:E3 ubiquitin-protein ligase HUWE1
VKNPKLDEATLREFTFTVIDEAGEEIELMENGRNIRVTKDNRTKYGNLVAQYYLHTEVKDEMRAFTEGFHDVIDKNLSSILDPDELEFLLGGVPFLDIEDWRVNTQFSGQFHEKHLVIQWFWEILEKLSQD